MKLGILPFLFWLAVSISAIAQPSGTKLPTGWELYTTSPRLFHGSRDTASSAAGTGSGLIVGQPEASSTKYALLLQKISATDYKGRRVRLSAKVRAQDVSVRTGLWIRVDSADGESLAFDNMEDRPIKGNQEWTTVNLEMDIPVEGKEIHYGLLLCGPGRANVDNLSLTVLGEARPVAKSASRVRSLPRAPVNGDFER